MSRTVAGTLSLLVGLLLVAYVPLGLSCTNHFEEEHYLPRLIQYTSPTRELMERLAEVVQVQYLYNVFFRRTLRQDRRTDPPG